jgi:O-antigen/teichoic acid export membrane protein
MATGAARDHRVGSKRSSLLGATFVYGLGRFAPQVINFLLLPVYSVYLTPEDLGLVEVFTLTQTVLVVVGRLGLAGAITRMYSELGEGDRFRDLVTTVVWTVSSATLLVTGAAGAALWLGWTSVGVAAPFWPLVPVTLSSALLQPISEIQVRLLQVRERVALGAYVSALSGASLTLFSLTFVVGLGWGALGVMAAGLVVNAVRGLAAIMLHRSDVTGRWRLQCLKEAARYGFPLIPHHLAGWADQAMARLMVGGTQDVASVGVLGISSRLTSPLQLFGSAFTTAFNPIFFRWRTECSLLEATRRTERVLGVLVVWTAVAVFGAGWLGPQVVRHLIAEPYRNAAQLVWLLALSRALRVLYYCISADVFYSKKTERVTFIYFCSALVNAVVVWTLGPDWGALAGACGELSASTASLLMASFVVRYSFAPRPRASRVMLGLGLVALSPLGVSLARLDAATGAGGAVLGVAVVLVLALRVTWADLRVLRQAA